VGGGYEHERYKAMAQELGLSEQVKFLGFMPAAEALTKGRLMIIPSRKESFPYVVLEAAAAEVPMIVSNVGGIPEILPPQMMFSTLHGEGLSRHIAMALAIPEQVAEDARQLALKLLNETNARQMTRQITDFYATL
jgi:glycosyltransferase involved in cell wall biosynthesis